MSLENEDMESLVVRYSEAAAAHGRATECGDHEAGNVAHEQISTIYRELRRRGEGAQRALLPLLANPDIGVRAWAAAHALDFAPSEAEPVLAAISQVPKSLVAFSAKVTLRQWHASKLRLPIE